MRLCSVIISPNAFHIASTDTSVVAATFPASSYSFSSGSFPLASTRLVTKSVLIKSSIRAIVLSSQALLSGDRGNSIG